MPSPNSEINSTTPTTQAGSDLPTSPSQEQAANAPTTTNNTTSLGPNPLPNTKPEEALETNSTSPLSPTSPLIPSDNEDSDFIMSDDDTDEDKSITMSDPPSPSVDPHPSPSQGVLPIDLDHSMITHPSSPLPPIDVLNKHTPQDNSTDHAAHPQPKKLKASSPSSPHINNNQSSLGPSQA
ncbi:hypothetical protein H4219_006138 [Mycoemilia scoparia]|uniref:Uncharacterized protein n=1 Tax=Mycoemilia scoparia TaxID=417184 RepID=A0A9W7ZRC1_9FUNG|nr:hypothetical protein H4219_006138 [Mycoemilia scoparia]